MIDGWPSKLAATDADVVADAAGERTQERAAHQRIELRLALYEATVQIHERAGVVARARHRVLGTHVVVKLVSAPRVEGAAGAGVEVRIVGLEAWRPGGLGAPAFVHRQPQAADR